MAVGSFFLSVILTAKKTAQSSPELHLRFSNTFIQSSLLESLSLICNIIKIGGDLTGFQLSLAQITVLNICLPTVQRLIVIEQAKVCNICNKNLAISRLFASLPSKSFTLSKKLEVGMLSAFLVPLTVDLSKGPFTNYIDKILSFF